MNSLCEGRAPRLTPDRVLLVLILCSILVPVLALQTAVLAQKLEDTNEFEHAAASRFICSFGFVASAFLVVFTVLKCIERFGFGADGIFVSSRIKNVTLF